MSKFSWRTAVVASVSATSLILFAPGAIALDGGASLGAKQSAPRVYGRADGTTVAASWTAVDNVRDYTVVLVDAVSGKEIGEQKHGLFTREFFYNVAPGTYKIKVTAWTNGTESNEPFFSDALTVTSVKTVPAAPDAPAMEMVLGKKVRVEWARNSNGGLDIDRSTVTLTPQAGGDPVVAIVDGDNTSAEIGGLSDGKTYTATVTAHNALGDSKPSPASNPVQVTADPGEIYFNFSPKQIDTTKDTEVTVTGRGYTGGSVKQGLYIVVWDTEKWTPGFRPSSADRPFGMSVEVKPSEIVNGEFTKKITIPKNKLQLNKGLRYMVGTIAGGSNLPIDRRADKAILLELAAQPVPYVEGTVEGSTVTASWGDPTDDRAREFTIKLYKVENGKNVYVNQVSRGGNVREATFNDVKPGTYVTSVIADISTNYLNPEYSDEVFSKPFQMKAPQREVPAAPGKPTLQPGDASNSLKVSWIDGEKENSARTTGYTIIFSNGSTQVVKTAQPDDSSLTFTGFPQGSWTAQIIAESAVGDSPLSEVSDPVDVAGVSAAHSPVLNVSQELVDTTKDATVSVTGSGFEDTDTVTLALASTTNRDAPLISVEVPVKNGQLDYELKIPAGTLDASKKYTLRTFNGNDYEAEALLKLADAAVANPQISVSPSIVDGETSQQVTVAGTGYQGDGAAKGVYVVVYDVTTWRPGTALSKSTNLAAQTWVQPAEIKGGAFTTTLSIPKGALEKGKTYAVGTVAAHALSQTNRSLDFSSPLVVNFGEENPQPIEPSTSAAPQDPADPSADATPTNTPDPVVPPKQDQDLNGSQKSSSNDSDSAQPFIIAGSVIGALTVVAAILGAVMHFFPNVVRDLLARIGQR